MHEKKKQRNETPKKSETDGKRYEKLVDSLFTEERSENKEEEPEQE